MKLTTLVVMFAAVSALAQTSERIDVNVVNVDVTVLDRHGHSVRGLTKNDFELFEDGRRQEITQFAAAPSGHRAVDIVVDMRFAQNRLEMNQSLTALEDMVSGAEEGSTWSVHEIATMGNLETIAPATADRQLVRAALDAVRRGTNPPAHDGMAATVPFDPNDDFECETADCLAREYAQHPGVVLRPAEYEIPAAILQAIHRLRLTTGNKAILIVSPAAGSPGGELASSIVNHAAAAGTRLYVLGSGGYFFTRATGGMTLAGNGAKAALQKFDEVTTSAYELAFATGFSDGRFHSIEVRLLKPGRYTVLHRDSYLRAAGR